MNPYDIIPHIRLCLFRKCYEGWTLPVRTISDHEIVLMLGGRGSFTIEGRKNPVSKGMLFYFTPGLVHSGETDINDPMRFYAVHFIYTHVNYFNGKWINVPGNSNLPFLHVQQIANYFNLANILRKLNECWTSKLPGYQFICRSYLQQAFFNIYDSLNSQSINYSASLRVEKVINYMHENIDKRVNMTALALMLDISPQYLSKIFKEITGVSAIEYFNRVKIDKAKELIFDGSKKVKEVAHILGFKDEFYFSRLFKKVEGISPSEFYAKFHESL